MATEQVRERRMGIPRGAAALCWWEVGMGNHFIPPIIGIDAEWVRREDKNYVLSYQYAGIFEGKGWAGIIRDVDDKRLTFERLIVRAIQYGRDAGKLPHKWPEEVIVTAHFSRADLSAFKNLKWLKDKFDGVRKTYVSAERPYRTTLWDRNKHSHKVSVYLIDTMLLTPNGKSLAHLGELHGLEKMELPEGMIEQMDVLLKDDPELFERYAVRDAEISVLHIFSMMKFVRDDVGLDKLPVTIGGIAIAFFLRLLEQENIDLHDVRGTEVVVKAEWDEDKQKLVNRRLTVPIAECHTHQAHVTECYHGGRNEAFLFGITKQGVYYDFDLPGAYTTAMSAIKMPDYQRIRVTNDLEGFSIGEMGFARVRFTFPDDTRFPCLPVRTVNGLIYPLEGESWATSPEIVLARQMGAEIEILHGLVIPWASDVRPFELFVEAINQKRNENNKGSLIERLWKEIGNSLYGKTAQGLMLKRAFNTRSGKTEQLPESKVTCAYLAAYTTGLVRAVVSELLEAIPEDAMVVSVTTDGFLTNAALDEIDTSGALTQFFSKLRLNLSNDPAVLEEKHRVSSVLSFKTRGQLTYLQDDREKPVIAKAGIKPPKGTKDENVYMVDLFLNRDGGTSLPVSSLISMRDMYDNDSDLVNVDIERHVNMEYDWKRELCNPLMREGHLYLDSRPWKTVGQFEKTRQLFDKWRKDQGGVLKTVEDWLDWQTYLETAPASAKGVKRCKGGLKGQLISVFCKAYAKGMWGLSGKDYADVSRWLSDNGFPCKESSFKNAGRKQSSPPEANVFQRDNEKVKRFIDLVLSRFPEFEWQRLVEGESCS